MTKNKKILLWLCIVIAAVIVVLSCLVWIIEKMENSNVTDPDNQEIEYNFYPINFEENIHEDTVYLNLVDAYPMRWCDSSRGITYGVQPESTAKHGEELAFLVDYIQAIIEGDHEAYNACFSDAYYESGRSPKSAFTMQKLYDVLLTRKATEKVSDGNDNYTKYTYEVSYLIHENNGTFRRDIGDGKKPQYLVVTNRTGDWKIDSSVTPSTKTK